VHTEDFVRNAYNHDSSCNFFNRRIPLVTSSLFFALFIQMGSLLANVPFLTCLLFVKIIFRIQRITFRGIRMQHRQNQHTLPHNFSWQRAKSFTAWHDRRNGLFHANTKSYVSLCNVASQANIQRYLEKLCDITSGIIRSSRASAKARKRFPATWKSYVAGTISHHMSSIRFPGCLTES
jgi:hypothetical protein